jgi:hypothetical protein
MRRHLLLLPLLVAASACGAPDDGKGDTDEVVADTDDTVDTTPGGDTDEVAGDTDSTPVEDTDVAVPFDPVGTWTLSGATVTSHNDCQGQPSPLSDVSVTWTESSPSTVQLKMSAFSDTFMCTRSGPAVTCNSQAYRSDRTGYYTVLTAGLSMTLGPQDGTATVVRTDTRTCTPTSGTCPPYSGCSTVNEWDATKP